MSAMQKLGKETDKRGLHLGLAVGMTRGPEGRESRDLDWLRIRVPKGGNVVCEEKITDDVERAAKRLLARLIR